MIFESMMNSLPYSVFAKDVNSNYLACNGHYAQTVGLADSALISGLTDYELNSKDYADYYRCIDRDTVEGASAIIVEPVIDGNHQPISVISSKRPLLDEHQNIIGTLGCFKVVAKGLLVDKPQVMSRLDDGVSSKSSLLGSSSYVLSKRESQCLLLLSIGYSAKEIAAKLFLSSRTVEAHISKLYTKLDCNSRSEIREKCFKSDLLSLLF